MAPLLRCARVLVSLKCIPFHARDAAESQSDASGDATSRRGDRLESNGSLFLNGLNACRA